jgi:ribonuclease P protein component
VLLTHRVDSLRLWREPEGIIANAVLRVAPDFMSAKMTARFPRTARLLRHADFERVYKQGRRHFSATMTVYYWPRPQQDEKSSPQGLRVGFTVSRALGGAVQRNRIKRRLREAVRMTRPGTGVPADVVINPKKSLLAAAFEDIKNEVGRAFAVIEQKLAPKTSNKAADAGPR